MGQEGQEGIFEEEIKWRSRGSPFIPRVRKLPHGQWCAAAMEPSRQARPNGPARVPRHITSVRRPIYALERLVGTSEMGDAIVAALSARVT